MGEKRGSREVQAGGERVRRLLTAADVAARYRVPVRTPYSWVDQGLLPARRCGKVLLRFTEEDLAEFERRSAEAAS
jgi:excisionase family DNA binding protein